MPTENTVDALISFATSAIGDRQRVCPLPNYWVDFTTACGIPDGPGPLGPLILGGWLASDHAKRERLFDQIRFAGRSPETLAAAAAFLRSLPADAWHVASAGPLDREGWTP